MCSEGEEREELEDQTHEPWGGQTMWPRGSVGNQAAQGSSQVEKGSQTPPEAPEQGTLEEKPVAPSEI